MDENILFNFSDNTANKMFYYQSYLIGVIFIHKTNIHLFKELFEKIHFNATRTQNRKKNQVSNFCCIIPLHNVSKLFCLYIFYFTVC